MNDEKYKVVKVINHNEWLSGCPLYVLRSQIVQNVQSKRMFVINEMANIGTLAVRDVVLKAECFDADQNLIMSMENCVYQMVNARKQSVFGETKLFSIFEETDTICLTVKSVTMTDGTVWSNKDLKRGIRVGKPIRIEEEGEVYDIVMMRCQKVQIKPKYWPYALEGGWRCTCGQLNSTDEEKCTLCRAPGQWLLKNLNRKQITKNKDLIQEEMRLMAEQEAEELRREEEEKRREEERVAALLKARDEKLMKQLEEVHQYNDQVAKSINHKRLEWLKKIAIVCAVCLAIFWVVRPDKEKAPEENQVISTSNKEIQTENETQEVDKVVQGQVPFKPSDESSDEAEHMSETGTMEQGEERVTEAPTETPVEEVTEAPTEIPTEKPMEKPTKAPSETAAELPSKEVSTETEIELVFEDISTATKASQILYDAGLIDSVESFNQYLTDTGLVTKVGEGTFRFRKGMSYEEIANIITRRNQ